MERGELRIVGFLVSWVLLFFSKKVGIQVWLEMEIIIRFKELLKRDFSNKLLVTRFCIIVTRFILLRILELTCTIANSITIFQLFGEFSNGFLVLTSKILGGFTAEEMLCVSTVTIYKYLQENEWKSNSQLGFVNTGSVKPFFLLSATEEEALWVAVMWQTPMCRPQYDFWHTSHDVLVSQTGRWSLV